MDPEATGWDSQARRERQACHSKLVGRAVSLDGTPTVGLSSFERPRPGAEEWARNKRLALLGGQLAPKVRPTLVKEAAETLLRSSAPELVRGFVTCDIGS